MISSERIRKGTTLEENMIEYRNPGTGIPPKLAHKVLGKRAKIDIDQDILLQPDLFE